MAEPDANAPNDGIIEALRLVRGLLDGEPGPWEPTGASVCALAILLISVLRAQAEMQGITGRDFQDDWLRGWLDSVYEGTSLTALQHDIRAHEASDG